MSIRAATVAIAAAASFLFMSSVPGFAQATRTWVSGVGDDANPCSRTAPCKTFAGAISKTAAGGEISVLDPGGYGSVTITKSISLISEGTEGSILATGTVGIIINSPTAIVHIRGLLLEGAVTGVSGIRILQAASVNIENCLIRNFRADSTPTNGGIDIIPSTANTKIVVTDTILSDNNRGITASPTGAGTAQVVLNRVLVATNAGAGVRAAAAAATFWLNGTTITGNLTGISVAAGGVVNTFGNNVNVNNGANTPAANGAPTTAPIAMQ
jgi:hypothetical protein